MMTTALLRIFVLLAMGGLAACQTDKAYLGQRVKASRWVDGRVVYILEDGRTVYGPVRKKLSQEDRRDLDASAQEIRAAAEGVVFAPIDAPTPTSETPRKK
jgi:hypothetical protein